MTRKYVGAEKRGPRLHPELLDLLEIERQEAGAKTVSAYLWDLLCHRYGRQDLIREKDKAPLPIDTRSDVIRMCLRQGRPDLAHKVLQSGPDGELDEEAPQLELECLTTNETARPSSAAAADRTARKAAISA
ncbi:hypothetical protein [Nocardia transvalensis]|uniref:hypothetical protein n=1 Tax=Nocardia transvalensis TaxID=37333 RepID=UPI0018960034|nr:hypothetical protein [Nocardia transvalensis]MBF6333644.1 hypothetical protein [Nocardia transvalensis]